jgi:hypothetical protein
VDFMINSGVHVSFIGKKKKRLLLGQWFYSRLSSLTLLLHYTIFYRTMPRPLKNGRSRTVPPRRIIGGKMNDFKKLSRNARRNESLSTAQMMTRRQLQK